MTRFDQLLWTVLIIGACWITARCIHRYRHSGKHHRNR